MSLLSVDITKVKRLSLKKLETKPEPIKTSPPEPPQEPNSGLDVPRLTSISQELLRAQESYTRDAIIDKIQEVMKIPQDRAERGFNMMLQAGALEVTPANTYYLSGSTPF
jgi:hypothetical protein